MRDSRFAEAWEQHDRGTPEEIAQARASGRAIAEGPADAAHLRKAQDALASHRAGVWQSFHEELVAAACEDPGRRAAWSTALQGAFEAARMSFSTTVAGKRDDRAIEAASRDWQDRTDPFSVWSTWDPHDTHERGDFWSLGPLLLQLAPAEGLRAIDSLPYPGLMKEILYLFCKEDRALIESLIQAAPPIFDDQGGWVPQRSVAALLVLDLVTKHAEALHSAVSRPIRVYGRDESGSAAQQAAEDLEKRELPEWMRQEFRMVLQRPDGQRMALGYLAQLSRHRLLRGKQTDGIKEQWRAGDAALVALAEALGEASVGVARVRDAWTAAEQLARGAEQNAAKRTSVRRRSTRAKSDLEGEGARSLRAEGLPFLYGAAAILGDASTSSAEDLELFSLWLSELLVGRDPGLSLLHHGASLTDVPQHFGFLLSRLSNPQAFLRAAYGALEAQRRRALFAYRYEDIYPDLESVFLLRVGLNAAANWLDRVKDGTQAEAAYDLFYWIYEAARRLWLTAVLDTGNTKQQLVVACYAFMPLLFGNRLGEALKRTIPPIANDARVLTEACANLRLNRLEAEEVSKLAAEAGADLLAALRNVHQWSQLTGLADNFPEHLRKLASELGLRLALEAPESK